LRPKLFVDLHMGGIGGRSGQEIKGASARDYRKRTVIVAMIAMRVVQASVDQVISMVSMRNRFMTATWAMLMRRIVSYSAMLWVAPIRIRRANFDHVFVCAPVFNVLQMAMVKIVEVVLMLNGDVAATRTMQMRLIGRRHDSSFSSSYHLPATHN
jgi:hypothetical protein